MGAGCCWFPFFGKRRTLPAVKTDQELQGRLDALFDGAHQVQVTPHFVGLTWQQVRDGAEARGYEYQMTYGEWGTQIFSKVGE